VAVSPIARRQARLFQRTPGSPAGFELRRAAFAARRTDVDGAVAFATG
jgi:hypothetical protein